MDPVARILVIEEALELRIALTRFLSALDHDVVALASAVEIPQLASKLATPIELAILDVPGADPRAMQSVTLMKGAFPGVRIIVTTRPEVAAALRSPAPLSQALGVTAAIFKPYTAEQLRDVLERVLAPDDSNGNG